MIAPLEMKEDLSSFPMEKRLTKSYNFLKNAIINNIDEICSIKQYFVYMLKTK